MAQQSFMDFIKLEWSILMVFKINYHPCVGIGAIKVICSEFQKTMRHTFNRKETMKILEKLKHLRKEYRKRRLRKKMERINPTPREYRQWEHRYWGDKIDITRLNPNGTFRIVGWLPQRPKHGDKLIYDVESGRKAVGYIVNVEYCRDPRDMFFADVIPYDYYELK